MIARRANPDDSKALAELFDQYRVFYRKESQIKNAINFLSDRLNNGDSVIYLVENDDQKIMGFTQLYPLYSSTRMKPLWLLNDLFVAKAYRAMGVARILINCAKKLCEETGACDLILETEKSNATANQLYRKTGFKLDTEHNRYSWSE